MSPSILLQGGTVLVPDGETDRVVPVRKDVLLIGDRIAGIDHAIDLAAHGISAADAQVVDCSARIVAPGFIDTHHHLWQTQLRGRHGDDTLLDYMPSGNFTAAFFTPADIFWGQLGGALEALDAGTTTVVDQAHMNYSAEHSDHALAGTMASGIRSIFCYTPTPLVTGWHPLQLSPSVLQPWHQPQIRRFASLLAAHPTVQLGFGFDGYAWLPPETTQTLFQEVRAAGVRCITSHSFQNPLLSAGPSAITTMANLGLLGPDVIISHAAGATPAEEALLAEHGVFVSCTPACEMHQGLGARSPFDDSGSARPRNSLGCDSHSVVRGSMLDQLRLATSAARDKRTKILIASNKFPRTLRPTLQDTFQLATCQAARAVGRAHDLGKLKVGFKADIVTWDCQSPNMVCAAAQDPLAALLGHAGTRDIDCVIVDGVFRKRAGKLCDCSIREPARDLLQASGLGASSTEGSLSWKRVASALEQSRLAIETRMAQAPMIAKNGRDALMQAFGLDQGALTD